MVTSCCVHDCTNCVKTALSEQKQGALKTSVSAVAPEMQYNRSKSISHTFFTLLPTKGGVAADVAQRNARAIITFGTMYTVRVRRSGPDFRDYPGLGRPSRLCAVRRRFLGFRIYCYVL